MGSLGALDGSPMAFVGANPLADAHPRDSSVTHPAVSYAQHSAVNNIWQLMHISVCISTGCTQSFRPSQGGQIRTVFFAHNSNAIF